jgi:anti-sigma factor RsiW
MTAPSAPRDVRLLVDAYVDGELDPVNALAFEQRLAEDPALAAEHSQVEALRKLMHSRIAREAAPADLRARVAASVGLGVRQTPLSGRYSRRASWQALAASAALAAVLGSGSTWLLVRPPPGEEVAEAVVASHMRALMAPQPADVSSSDRHTVKPWFNGRIPQAPRVVDLTGEGFPLIGGRLDVVGRVPVPTLVYRHRQHLVSLVAIPESSRGGTSPVRRTIDGYNVLGWSQDGVAYWVVSDLGMADLDNFARAFRAAVPEP